MDTLPARSVRTLPLTRGDCPEQRPCPHVSCKWHLLHVAGDELDTKGMLELTREVRVTAPLQDEDIVDLALSLPAEASCTLDVADDPEAAADALYPDGAYHLRTWLREWAETPDTEVSPRELVEFVCRRLDVSAEELRGWCVRGALPPMRARTQLDELTAAIGTPHRAGIRPVPVESWGAHSADGQRQRGVAELGEGITEDACGRALGRGLTGIQFIIASVREQLDQSQLRSVAVAAEMVGT